MSWSIHKNPKMVSSGGFWLGTHWWQEATQGGQCFQGEWKLHRFLPSWPMSAFRTLPPELEQNARASKLLSWVLWVAVVGKWAWGEWWWPWNLWPSSQESQRPQDLWRLLEVGGLVGLSLWGPWCTRTELLDAQLGQRIGGPVWRKRVFGVWKILQIWC